VIYAGCCEQCFPILIIVVILQQVDWLSPPAGVVWGDALFLRLDHASACLLFLLTACKVYDYDRKHVCLDSSVIVVVAIV